MMLHPITRAKAEKMPLSIALSIFVIPYDSANLNQPEGLENIYEKPLIGPV
jgi:hypothetical protein